MPLIYNLNNLIHAHLPPGHPCPPSGHLIQPEQYMDSTLSGYAQQVGNYRDPGVGNYDDPNPV
jgi:hypothetical protein